MESDTQEALEFLLFVPKYVWLLHLGYIVLSFIAWKIFPFFIKSIYGISNKYRRYLGVVTIIILILPTASTLIINNNFKDLQDYEAPFPVNIIGFYIDLSSAPYIYWQKKSALMEQAKKPATWHIQSVKPNYKNYVLVIGESARADYMHAYGFPLNNTPFLSNSKALLIDGYLSTAEFTMLSLPQTLSLRNPNAIDENSKYFREQSWLSNNNIISLAKMAGFETAWLSNQGMIGAFANEMSTYAQRSDSVYYTQRGDYQNSYFLGDSLLLPQMKKILEVETKRPRLIVMHLMGSHHDFCKRLEKPTSFQFKSEKISCYVGTIKQTDDLLRDAVTLLEKKGEPWSLVYFSDHGLKHIGLETHEASLQHGGDTYESFYVPLVKISSDDTKQRKIKVQRSAFYFLTGFAQWLGLDVIELYREHYDFWGDEDDLPTKDNNLGSILKMPKDPYEK